MLLRIFVRSCSPAAPGLLLVRAPYNYTFALRALEEV